PAGPPRPALCTAGPGPAGPGGTATAAGRLARGRRRRRSCRRSARPLPPGPGARGGGRLRRLRRPIARWNRTQPRVGADHGPCGMLRRCLLPESWKRCRRARLCAAQYVVEGLSLRSAMSSDRRKFLSVRPIAKLNYSLNPGKLD
ncbi:unnamed protein product, partial [Heterosigma akashiwo]